MTSAPQWTVGETGMTPIWRQFTMGAYVTEGDNLIAFVPAKDPDVSRAHAHLFAASPALRDALEEATKHLTCERDTFYDQATGPDGEYTHPEDAEVVTEMDDLINRCQAAISKAEVPS